MADPGPSSTEHAFRLDVDIVRRAAIWTALDVSDEKLRRAAAAAFAVASTPGHFEVSLALVDDAEMRELNRLWRRKDSPTNVLSFPAGQTPARKSADASPLGDVILAAETVEREANAQGVSVGDHAAHLVVHGLLHLLGFDHEHDAEARKMEALEIKVLGGLGIADPYAQPAEAAQ